MRQGASLSISLSCPDAEANLVSPATPRLGQRPDGLAHLQDHEDRLHWTIACKARGRCYLLGKGSLLEHFRPKDYAMGPKSRLKLVAPTSENRAAGLNRCPNAEFRIREHLTPTGVQALIDAAKTNRYGTRNVPNIFRLRLARNKQAGNPDSYYPHFARFIRLHSTSPFR